MIMNGRPREFDDEAVIEAAMDVFWRHGFEASSTQELCARTGLGRGSLYNAFGSKQGLYEKALRHYHELGIKMQLDILNGSGTVTECLHALLEWGIRTDLECADRRSCMALFAAMERCSKDPVVDQITRMYVTRLEQALCYVFALGQRSGEINTHRTALELTRGFLSSYYGLRVLGQTMPDRDFLYDALAGILANLTHT